MVLAVPAVSEARLREILEDVLTERERKERSVAFSDMKTEDHERLEGARLSSGVRLVPVAAPQGEECLLAPVHGYPWTDQTEAQQTPACMSWLQSVVKLPRDKVFVDVRKQADLLNVSTASAPWLPFSLKGTSDVAIVDRPCVAGRVVSRGLLVLFELKKAVRTHDVQQALAQLIAADVHSRFAVVAVLTDLNEEWHFFWAEEGAIKQMTVQLAHAIICMWLNLIVRADDSARTPLAKRQKLSHPADLPDFDTSGLDDEDALRYRLALAGDVLSRTPLMYGCKLNF
jgi:hypothetical protein